MSFPKIKRIRGLLPVFLVLCFLVYFASAGGLYNSMDTPQYFTTEALIHYKDIDLSHFNKDQHYNFIYYDFFNYKDKVYGLRGYLLSVISIPLHVAGSFLQEWIRPDGFPDNATQSPHFAHELATVSLFSIYTLIGLFFFWKTIYLLTQDDSLATIISFALAFGTFLWKYSTSYARQGFLVMLLAITGYAVTKLWYEKHRLRWILVLFFCTAISFGIDTVVFYALSAYCVIYSLYLLRHLSENKLEKNYQIQKLILAILLFLQVVGLNVYFNYKWYGTFNFSQYNRTIQLARLAPSKREELLTSTPIFPTIYSVLFSRGPLPPSIFEHFKDYPPDVAYSYSVKYAMKYSYFGLFIVSPFLLLGFLVLPWVFTKNRYRPIIFYSFFIALLGILGNLKFFAFYASNQYDVRYFYPFVMCLGIPTALALASISRWKRWYLSVGMYIVFLASILFSLAMGWMGVLNMFQPALTGERKIWVEYKYFFTMLKSTPPQTLYNNTFLNRNNIWMALILSFIVYNTYFIGSRLVKSAKIRKWMSKWRK